MYILAADRASVDHSAHTTKLAAQCASGSLLMASNNAVQAFTSSPNHGEPALVYVDATPRGRTQAILQLAAHLVNAHSLKADMKQGRNDHEQYMQHTCLEQAALAVSSEAEVQVWKAKCRAAFGSGFKTSWVNLAEMGACEARQRAAGKSASLSPALLSLFGSQM